MEFFGGQMEWCREQAMKLIGLVREKPELWDPDCKDRCRKNEIWAEIAAEMQTSKAEVQYKMRKLTGQFHRERKRMESGGFVVRWYAFDALRFLVDKSRRPQPEGSASSSTFEDNIPEDKKPISTEDDDFTDEAENELSLPEKTTPVLKKSAVPQLTLHPFRRILPKTSSSSVTKNVTDKEASVSLRQFNAMPRNVPDHHTEVNLNHPHDGELHPAMKRFKGNERRRDEFDVFGEYIASQLRTFSDPRDRALAKHRMNQIIFEIEMSQVNRDDNTTADSMASSTYSYDDSYSSIK